VTLEKKSTSVERTFSLRDQQAGKFHGGGNVGEGIRGGGDVLWRRDVCAGARGGEKSPISMAPKTRSLENECSGD